MLSNKSISFNKSLKNEEELKQNIFLNKKRKKEDKGFAITFPNRNKINIINEQLEEDNNSSSCKIVGEHFHITSDEESSEIPVQNSKEKEELGKNLGICVEHKNYSKESNIDVVMTKSGKSSKSKRSTNSKNIKKVEVKEMKHNNIFSQDFIGIPTSSIASTLALDYKESINKSNINKNNFNKEIPDNFYPWLTERTKDPNLRGMIKLHFEILDFYEFVKPTVEEDLLRDKTVKILKNKIKENWPNLKIKKFGSFPNKIHLPDSDIDIVVLTDDKEGKGETQIKILHKITQKLIENDLVDYIRIIEARVPIIRATLKETKINLDISAERKNGYEAKKVIKNILQDFPCLRPLIYVLKYFLRQRKLNESYTGGISSFLLFNLLVSYIQYLNKERKKNKSKDRLTLGHLLVGFFQFYAFDFNFEQVGISVRYGGYFYKRSDQIYEAKRSNNLLSVENFQELGQDLGKGSFKFRKVLDCFKQARDALYYPSSPIVSNLGQFINVDNFLIRRYEKLRQHNHKLK